MQSSILRSGDAPPGSFGQTFSDATSDFLSAAGALVALRGAPPAEATRVVTEVAKDGRKVVLSLVDDAVAGTIDGAPAGVAKLVEALGFTRFFNAVGNLAKGAFGKVFGGAVGVIADVLVNAKGGPDGTLDSPQVVKLTQAYMERMAAENPERLVLRKTEFIPGKPLYQLRDRQTNALYLEAGGELGVRRHGDVPEPQRQAIPADRVVMAPVGPGSPPPPKPVLPSTVNPMDPFGTGTPNIPGPVVLPGASSLIGQTFGSGGAPRDSAVSENPPFIEDPRPVPAAPVLPPVTLPPDPLAPLAKAHGTLLDRFMALKLDYDPQVAFEQGKRFTPEQAKALGQAVKAYESAYAADPMRANTAPALELAPAKAALKGFEAATARPTGTPGAALSPASEEALEAIRKQYGTGAAEEIASILYRQLGPLGNGPEAAREEIERRAGETPGPNAYRSFLEKTAGRSILATPTQGASGGTGGTNGNGGTATSGGPEESGAGAGDPVLAENAATLAAIASAETGRLIGWAKGQGVSLRAQPPEIQREILLTLAARYDSLDPAEKADADAIARTILGGISPGLGTSTSANRAGDPRQQLPGSSDDRPTGGEMPLVGLPHEEPSVLVPHWEIDPSHGQTGPSRPVDAKDAATRLSSEPPNFTPHQAVAFLNSYGMDVYHGSIGDSSGRHSPSEFAALISALAPAIEHVESRFPGLLNGVMIAREQAEGSVVAEVLQQRIVTFRSLDFLRRWGEVKGESISDLAFHEFGHVIRNKTPDVVVEMLNWGLPLAVVDNGGSIPGSITADRLIADHLPGFPLWTNTLRVHGLRAVDMNGHAVAPEALSDPATPPYVVLSNRDGAPTRLELSGGLVSQYGEEDFEEAFAEIAAQFIGYSGPRLSPGPLDQRPALTGEGKPGFSEMPTGYLMRAMFFAIQDARRATVGSDGYFEIDGFPTILQFILDGNSILHPRRNNSGEPPPPAPSEPPPSDRQTTTERGPQQMASPADRPGLGGGQPFPPNVVNLLLPSAPSGFYQAAENVVFPENGVIVIGENSSVRSLGRIAQKVEANPYFSLGCPVYAAWCVSAERDTVTRTSEAQALHELIGAPVQGYLGYFTITPEGIRVPPPRNFGGDIPKLILPFRHEP